MQYIDVCYVILKIPYSQQQKGHVFETDTDTEVVAKLVKHLYDAHKENKIKFRELIELTVAQLVCFV